MYVFKFEIITKSNRLIPNLNIGKFDYAFLANDECEENPGGNPIKENRP